MADSRCGAQVSVNSHRKLVKYIVKTHHIFALKGNIFKFKASSLSSSASQTVKKEGEHLFNILKEHIFPNFIACILLKGFLCANMACFLRRLNEMGRSSLLQIRSSRTRF